MTKISDIIKVMMGATKKRTVHKNGRSKTILTSLETGTSVVFKDGKLEGSFDKEVDGEDFFEKIFFKV